MADLKQLDIEAGFAVTKAFTGQVDLLTQLQNTLTDQVNEAMNQWRGKSRADFDTVWQGIHGQIRTLKDELQAMHDHLNAEIQQVQEVFSN